MGLFASNTHFPGSFLLVKKPWISGGVIAFKLYYQTFSSEVEFDWMPIQAPSCHI